MGRRISNRMAKKVTSYQELEELCRKPSFDEEDLEKVGRYSGAGSGLADFFTPSCIASFLAHVLRPLLPAAPRVLEPSAGTGRILMALKSALPDAQLVAFEIGHLYRQILTKLAPEATINYDFLENPPERNSFDLVVGNPPYAKKKGFHKAGLEVEFCLRGLKALKEGGVMAMLVPDGVLSNRQALEFRKSLMEQHRLLAVASMPDHAFVHSGTHIKTSVLVVQKGRTAMAPLDKEHVWMDVIEKIGHDERGNPLKGEIDLGRALLKFWGFLMIEYGVDFRTMPSRAVDGCALLAESVLHSQFEEAGLLEPHRVDDSEHAPPMQSDPAPDNGVGFPQSEAVPPTSPIQLALAI